MTKADFRMRLATHSCAGKPIEYEDMIGSAIRIDPNAWIAPGGVIANRP
jgi:hypothetical protein